MFYIISKKIKHKTRPVVFIFLVVYSCFRPPNRLFFRLKTFSVVSLIRHSVVGNQKTGFLIMWLICSFSESFPPGCGAGGHNRFL